MLLPGNISFTDKICTLELLESNGFVSPEILQSLRNRRDELAEYIIFRNGEKTVKGASVKLAGKAAGELFSDYLLKRYFSKSIRSYVGFCESSSERCEVYDTILRELSENKPETQWKNFI